MPSPAQIVAAQTALNRVELALQTLQTGAENPQQSALAGQARADLSTARFNLS